jgi:hypothetical protein
MENKFKSYDYEAVLKRIADESQFRLLLEEAKETNHCKICGAMTPTELNDYCSFCINNEIGENMTYAERDKSPLIIKRRKKSGYYKREIERICDEFQATLQHVDDDFSVKDSVFLHLDDLSGKLFCPIWKMGFMDKHRQVNDIIISGDLVKYYRESIQEEAERDKPIKTDIKTEQVISIKLDKNTSLRAIFDERMNQLEVQDRALSVVTLDQTEKRLDALGLGDITPYIYSDVSEFADSKIQTTHTFSAELPDGRVVEMPSPGDDWIEVESQKFKRGDCYIDDTDDDKFRWFDYDLAYGKKGESCFVAHQGGRCWFKDFVPQLFRGTPILSITTWTRETLAMAAPEPPYDYFCPTRENHIGLEIWPGKYEDD